MYVGLGGRVNEEEEEGGWLVVLTLPALIVSNRKFGLPFWELIWQINADKMQATGQGQSSELEAESWIRVWDAALHGPTNRILMIVAWSACHIHFHVQVLFHFDPLALQPLP